MNYRGFSGAGRVQDERIAIYGEFGGGNFGNDASLDGILQILHHRWGYDVSKMLCFCRGPSAVSKIYGMRTLSISGRNPSRRLGSLHWLVSWLEKLRDLARMCVLVGPFSIIIVPGTGIVEEGVDAWGTPYDLYCLAVACRLRRTKLLVVCVGASVPRRPLTRRFYRHFLQAASYRSFRDEHSKGAATELGTDATNDDVYADLAMGLTAPGAPWPPSSPEVGLGLITHAGQQSRNARARSKHAAYVRLLTDFVTRLTSSGRRIRLLIGDEGDMHVVDEVLGGLGAADQVSTANIRSFADVVNELGPCDIVVASRYHNLIAAALIGRPTIALGYGPKHAALQQSLGLGEFAHGLDSVDSECLIKEVEGLRSNSCHWRRRVESGVARARAQLDRQEVALRDFFGTNNVPSSGQ